MSDYQTSADNQERPAMDRIEVMRQQFLDMIEADFGRAFEVFPDPEDLTLEAPSNTDNEAHQGSNHFVRVREMPLSPSC